MLSSPKNRPAHEFTKFVQEVDDRQLTDVNGGRAVIAGVLMEMSDFALRAMITTGVASSITVRP